MKTGNVSILSKKVSVSPMVLMWHFLAAARLWQVVFFCLFYVVLMSLKSLDAVSL